MGNDLSNPETLFELAQWYHDQGYLKEAEKRYLHILKLDPECDVTHNELGVLHCERENYYDAIDFLDRAIQLNPKDSKYHYNMAKALHMWGAEETDIIYSLTRALELNPKIVEFDPTIYRFYFSAKEIRDIKLRSKASILPWLFAATLAGAGVSNIRRQNKDQKSLKAKRANS